MTRELVLQRRAPGRPGRLPPRRGVPPGGGAPAATRPPTSSTARPSSRTRRSAVWPRRATAPRRARSSPTAGASPTTRSRWPRALDDYAARMSRRTADAQHGSATTPWPRTWRCRRPTWSHQVPVPGTEQDAVFRRLEAAAAARRPRPSRHAPPGGRRCRSSRRVRCRRGPTFPTNRRIRHRTKETIDEDRERRHPDRSPHLAHPPRPRPRHRPRRPAALGADQRRLPRDRGALHAGRPRPDGLARSGAPRPASAAGRLRARGRRRVRPRRPAGRPTAGSPTGSAPPTSCATSGRGWSTVSA